MMTHLVRVPCGWDIERGWLVVDQMEATQENIDNLQKDIDSLKRRLTMLRKKQSFAEYLKCNREIRWILPQLEACLSELIRKRNNV